MNIKNIVVKGRGEREMEKGKVQREMATNKFVKGKGKRLTCKGEN